MSLADVPKSTINLVSEFPQEQRNKLLKVACGVIQQSPHQDYYGAIKKHLYDKNRSKADIYVILSTLIAIVQLFLKSTNKEFVNKLLETGFTNDFIETLPLIENQDQVITNFCNSVTTSFHNFSEIKWRVDISLSNSSLVGKILPSVIILLSLKNGKTYTIEIDAKTFHKLRFNVALILKELSSVKKYLNK